MTSALLLSTLLLFSGSHPSAAIAPTCMHALADEEAVLRALANAVQGVLSTDSFDADAFLEQCAPSMRERYTDGRLKDTFAMFRRDVPNGQVIAVRSEGNWQGELILFSEATDQSIVLGVTLESEEPNLLSRFTARLERGDPRVPGLVDGMNSADMARVIDAYVTGLTEEDRFSGAVMLAKDGVPVFQKAYGLASQRFDVPNNMETLFNLGSMNKMITSVAINQLVEAGELNFDDTLIQHLPNFPNKDAASFITIDQLLTHTSGLGGFWGAMSEVDWTKLRTPADHLDLFANDPLQFDPGESYSYSNSGFLVLGLVIEAVSGQSYYDYVQENIYDPAGMERSGSYAMDEPIKNLAIGYTRSGDDGHGRDGPLRNNFYLHRVRGGPAGGGFSTCSELLRFANALLSYELLSEEATQFMLAGKVDVGPDARYAYGFMDELDAGHRKRGHNGGAPGISAVLSMFPDDGYTVIVLSNYDGAALSVGNRIGEMITRSDK